MDKAAMRALVEELIHEWSAAAAGLIEERYLDPTKPMKRLGEQEERYQERLDALLADDSKKRPRRQRDGWCCVWQTIEGRPCIVPCRREVAKKLGLTPIKEYH